MAQIQTWLKCDLQQMVQVVPLKGHLFSADSHANVIGVEITNNGIPYPVSGTLVLYGLRNDSVTVIARSNVSNTSRPSVELEDDFYNVIGPIQLVLRLLANGEETVLAACTTYVYRSTTSQLIDSGGVVPDLETLIARMDDCERAAQTANTAAANAQSQVNAAAQSAAAAQTAAQNAQTQAQNAASSASDAQTAAQNAAASAQSAQGSIQAIQTQANNAATAAANAQTAAQAAESSAGSAAQAAANSATAASTASTAASDAAADASAAALAATRAQQNATTAQTAAQSAQSAASSAAAQAGSALDAANAANTLANSVSQNWSTILPGLVNNAAVRNNALYLLHDEEIIAGPFSGFGGGGSGGGSSSNVNFTFASADGNTAYIFREGDEVILDLVWSSTENDEPTGNGNLKLEIDGVQKYSKNVPQGTIHENVTPYLRNGDNTLRFTLTDSYGNRRVRSFSVSVVNLSITSNFDETMYQTGAITFTYVPYGNIAKTMHFLIDGVEVATATVSGYGRQLSQILPAQDHGSHTLTVYFTATMNDETVSSNILHYDIVCIESGDDEVIITSSYNDLTVDQYSTINIPYMVYDPNAQTADVDILINGDLVQELTGVDRTKQIFSRRMDESGTQTITIRSGQTMKILVLTVNPVTIDAVAETEGLKLYLSSYGRSNNEATPGEWVFDQNGTEIAAQFSGFNWVNDGWQLDDDGISVMRVSGEARITIPYQPFANDKRTSGFTVEIDFATRDVRNYDSPILTCMNGGRGIQLTSQRFTLSSEGSEISMQFKENEHVRVSFVVEKRTSLRLIYCYINGIMSGVTRYPTTDNFAQASPQGITIGSDDATIDLYTIRFYDNDLPMKQIEDNWIADTPNGEEMIERFGRNDVRNINDEIIISKLPTDLPYMVISCPELPQYKGDKKTCTGSYVDPVNQEKSFTFENCEIDVQGTSSQYYARKNYKMKFNGGFTNSNGNTESKYKLVDDSIAVKTFVMKADVASSEGANNVELVKLYNDSCPYKTPAQVLNSKVRQGIDGYPMVIFWNNTDNNQTVFLGKYNFNNDKGTEDVFGFTEGDESWEVLNNTSDRVLYKSDDFTSMGTDEQGNPVMAWQADFECRYPDDDYVDYTQLKEFLSWVKSTDTTQATNAALSEVADFGETVTSEVNGQLVTTPITYTHDTAAYRLAKFRAEFGNYAESQSAMFYYIFTELFLMVDSRAKNSFPSFIGSVIEGEEENE